MRGASSSWRRRIVVAGCVALTIGLMPRAAQAQVTGGITGVVTDDTGAVLPGVTITVKSLTTSQVRADVTNQLGRYQVLALQPTTYSVTAELAGFSSVIRSGVTVNVGSTMNVDLSMKVASLQETVTVSGNAPLVQSAKTDLSSVISREILESLPSKNQQYLDFALLMPAASENVTRVQGTGAVIGGARSKEGALLVDGFYNLDEGFTMPKQRHSQETIQEFQVVTFGGAPEYGRAIGGVINAVTMSGTNQYHGAGYSYFRDDSMNATPFADARRGVPKVPASRKLWGGAFGGPIRRDKSFFFGSLERLDDTRSFDNGITAANAAAIGLPPQDVGTVPSFMKSWFFFGKWDHNINANQHLQLSFSQTDLTDHNFTYIFPLGARSWAQQLPFFDQAYVASWTKVAGEGRMFHELKASYFPRDYHSNGLNAGGPPLVADGGLNKGDATPASPPSVTISSVANFGSATLNNYIKTYPVQVLYSSSIYADKHTVKFGTDYMYAYYDYNQYSPYKGSYAFSSLNNFLAGNYSTYSQAFGDVANPRTHQYLSAFVQDSWSANSRLTMNYGLRYDLEFNPKQEKSGIPFGNDYNNIGPRFALSYDLTGKGTTFVKMTSGVYYDRIWNNSTNDLYDLKDNRLRAAATWRPTDPGAPVYPNTFTTRPAVIPAGVVDVVIMPDKVNVPTTGQVVGTLEHAITTNLLVSGSVVYTRSWFKEYRMDRNLSWNGQNYSRIDPNYRQIRQFVFDAPSEYVGGIVQLTLRGRRVGFDGNFTVARSGETSGVFSYPNDQVAGIRADYGPQPDTPTLRGVLNGYYNLHPNLQVSGVFRARTGYPINPVASGLDLNGDARFGDRTPTLAPFSFETPGSKSLDVRLAATLPLGNEDRKLSLYLETFNLFNTENVKTVDNNYGTNPATPGPNWMVPRSYFEAREVQLGVRFKF